MESKEGKYKPVLILIKPYTVKELAVIYGVCRFTFRKWVKPFEKEIGSRNGAYYSVNQVKIILEKLGTPMSPEQEHKMVA